MARVLLIAEAANPESASVPLEGWSHYRALARVADVHLVTHIRNAAAIERAGLRSGVDFTPIDSERLAYPIWRIGSLLRGGTNKGWTTVVALNSVAYAYFETLLWKQFGRSIRNRLYDVVHRLTPLSPTISSPIAAKCRAAGVPFVIGPLNGGLPWPPGFDRERRREREWLSYVRPLYKAMPGYHMTCANASAIIAGSHNTYRQLPRTFLAKTIYIPENGFDAEAFPLKERCRAPLRHPIRIAFVGRLVPYKGADMLLDAAASLLRQHKLTLDIIGDGPERTKLRSLVTTHQLHSAVTFHGWVPHSSLHSQLAQCQLFVFPSVREFGGAVVLEAMAMGLVPVVINYGGPGELVTDETGFRLPLGTRAEIVARLSHLLQELVDDPSCIEDKARKARTRVLSAFTWDVKAKQVLAVYHSVLESYIPRRR